VAGYREAFEAAPPLEIDPGFVVRVVSLPGLAILKLFAWADRGVADSRDAIDLAILLRQYGAAGNADRLYGAEIGVLEAASYDLDLAGARLLGRDAARINSRPRRVGSSALANTTGSLAASTTCCTRVVLPTCRAPATTWMNRRGSARRRARALPCGRR